jgi:hypothetical protein
MGGSEKMPSGNRYEKEIFYMSPCRREEIM